MTQLRTSKPPDAGALKAYVRSALEQWKFTAPLLRDKAAKDVRLLYSVDTDVIKLFTNPAEVAAETEGRGGYLQLFIDDNQDECIARGRVVADHIFRELTKKNTPLLLIPPLTNELVAIHDAVARHANTEQFGAIKELGEIQKTFELIRESGSHEDLYEIVKLKAPQLIRLIEDDDGGTAELRRFSILFRDQLVASPDYFTKQRVFDDSILSALRPAEFSLSLDYDLYNFREIWGRELRKRNKARNLERDIQALARIQLINQLLPKNVKLVHITGDAHVLAAGERIMLDDNRSFTERYLRHPRAFLAEPGILTSKYAETGLELAAFKLEPTSKHFSEFSKWLIVFLAKFWKRNYGEIYYSIQHGEEPSQPADMGDNAIEQFCNDFPETVSSFRVDWDNFSHNVTVEHARKTIDSMPFLRNVSSYLQSSFDEIATDISAQIDASWQSTFQSATATSYGLTRISIDSLEATKRVRARNIPLISFDSFRSTREFIKDIIETDSFVDIGNEKYLDFFKKIENEDNSGYLYNLSYATLFAAEGRWVLARILAERAFGLHNRSLNSDISGREAAYFSAVAVRNNAKKIADLNEAERWLDIAEECWKSDKQNRPGLNVSTLRFTAERLSLAMANECFKIFTTDHSDKDSKIQALKLLEQKFGLLLKDVLQELDRKSSVPDTNDEHEFWINKNLEKRIVVNLLMAALIRKFFFNEEFSEQDWQNTRNYHALLSANIKVNMRPQINYSYLYNIVWLLSKMWIDKDKGARREAERQLSEVAIDNFSIMPYDKQRFSFFRQVIAQAQT